ncbi:MAG: hypothetical protein IKY73_05945 [Bacteroidaceae bacterium]|nr:hypothetical protein [Bacteroidaceae bacterium]
MAKIPLFCVTSGVILAEFEFFVALASLIGAEWLISLNVMERFSCLLVYGGISALWQWLLSCWIPQEKQLSCGSVFAKKPAF